MRKNAKKYIELECCGCQIKFDKELKEYTRQYNKGNTKFYCNLKCRYDDVTDEYSPFRLLFKSSKKSAKNSGLDFNIDLEYLREIWNKQNGKCAYTNLEMLLPKNCGKNNIIHKHCNLASLDRIDSDKGYVKGNVEFICLSLNYAKSDMSKEEIMNFIQLIRNNDLVF